MAALNPTFSVSVGSARSSSASPVGMPRRLSVERDMGVPADSCELLLARPVQAGPGDEVQVELGMGDELKRVFTGEVVELRPSLEGFRLRALGKMNALLKLRVSAAYLDHSVGRIVRDLIDRAGLKSSEVSDGPTLPVFYVDQRASAYRFVRDLADRLGYELYTDREGKVMFKAHGAAAGLDSAGGGLGGLGGGWAAGALSAAAGALAGGAGGYRYGKELMAGGARRSEPAWGRVEVSGESPASEHGEESSHFLTANRRDFRGAAGDGKPVRILIDPAARTKELADRFAAGRLATARRGAGELFATVAGRAGVELGDPVTLADAPDGLVSGGGYVRAVRHRFGERTGFVTDLRVAAEEGS